MTDSPIPEPGQGEVRLQVAFFAVNGMDYKLRAGDLKDQRPLCFPVVLGYEAAGIVEEVGPGVETPKIGESVVGFTTTGAYAEYALARADQVAVVPPGLDLVEAATVPSAAETAQRIIRLIHPQAGETVVVNGAGGGVGTLAVQLLVSAGVHVVGTCSRDNYDYVSKLGATPTTYGDGVATRILGIAARGVDAVLDLGGHGFLDAALELGVDRARMVTIVDLAAGARGFTVSFGDVQGITAADFAEVIHRVSSGNLSTEVAQVFTFADLGAAHRLSESGHVRGKILVRGPAGR